MTRADILERAADVIDERGLCKAAFETKDGVCALGAISVVLNGYADAIMNSHNVLPYERFINELLGGSVVIWNDEPERTKDEVTAMLRGAAMTLRAQANTETVTEMEPS